MIEFLGESLTLERVKAAYEKTGLRPVYGVFDLDRCIPGYACALTAISRAEGRDFLEFNNWPQISSFIRGFDNWRRINAQIKGSWDEEAFNLGRACRAEICPENGDVLMAKLKETDGK